MGAQRGESLRFVIPPIGQRNMGCDGRDELWQNADVAEKVQHIDTKSCIDLLEIWKRGRPQTTVHCCCAVRDLSQSCKRIHTHIATFAP